MKAQSVELRVFNISQSIRIEHILILKIELRKVQLFRTQDAALDNRRVIIMFSPHYFR